MNQTNNDRNIIKDVQAVLNLINSTKDPQLKKELEKEIQELIKLDRLRNGGGLAWNLNHLTQLV